MNIENKYGEGLQGKQIQLTYQELQVLKAKADIIGTAISAKGQITNEDATDLITFIDKLCVDVKTNDEISDELFTYPSEVIEEPQHCKAAHDSNVQHINSTSRERVCSMCSNVYKGEANTTKGYANLCLSCLSKVNNDE